jgi:hypothetical protein
MCLIPEHEECIELALSLTSFTKQFENRCTNFHENSLLSVWPKLSSRFQFYFNLTTVRTCVCSGAHLHLDSAPGQMLWKEIKCLFHSPWPPLWSSGQSSWLWIHRSGFDSRPYKIFWEVVGLERSPLSLASIIEELIGRKNSDSGLGTEDTAVGTCHADHTTPPYPQKWALTIYILIPHLIGVECDRPLLAYCTNSGIWWVWSRRWNDWQGNPKCSEKTCTSAGLCTTYPTWSGLGSNPGRCGGKPATNHPSYCIWTSNITFPWP